MSSSSIPPITVMDRDGGTMNEREKSGVKTVAFCGTRGIPANYGGFETAVDEISRRFVGRGYDCVVFSRRSASEKRLEWHEDRRLVYVTGSPVRKLDTFVSAFQTGWHLLRHREEYGHVFWFNNANLPGILLTLLARIPTSVNTDGLEWRRAKWSWPFKAYYFLASFLISRLCGSLISDSRAIQAYYEKVFRRKTEFVPYGVPETPSIHPDVAKAILERYGLVAGRYFLQVTRFEPDNLPLEVARAFRGSGLARSGYKLLLVGYQHDTPYAREIRAVSDTEEGILLSRAIYQPEVLAVLRANCFCYAHGNSVGGTNPALLEAMANCPRVLAIDKPFSRELLGETGCFFEMDNMVEALRNVQSSPDRSGAMQARVRSRYDWDAVVESYVHLVEGRAASYRLF